MARCIMPKSRYTEFRKAKQSYFSFTFEDEIAPMGFRSQRHGIFLFRYLCSLIQQ